jgi:hypothetical protein
MSEGGGNLQCPDCELPLAPSQNFCPNCGASLASTLERAPSPSVSDGGPESWDWVATMDENFARPRAQARTRLGLLLMIFAFGLLWIPLVSDLGELLALIGIVFLWLGRHAYGNDHRRNVILGSACVALGFLIAVLVGIWLVDSLLTSVAPGQSASSFDSVFQSDLGVVFVVGFLTSALTALAYVVLPWALADRTSRVLLLVAGALTVVISAVTASILLPQVSSAVAQATSGSTIDSGPIVALQNESSLLMTAQLLPDALFVWSYYRTRQQRFFEQPNPHRPPNPGGTSGGPP